MLMRILTREIEVALDSLQFLYMQKRIQDRLYGKAEIAFALRETEDFVAQALAKLARAGFISSRVGSGGGYEVVENSLDASLVDFFEVFERSFVTDPLKPDYRSSTALISILKNICSSVRLKDLL